MGWLAVVAVVFIGGCYYQPKPTCGGKDLDFSLMKADCLTNQEFEVFKLSGNVDTVMDEVIRTLTLHGFDCCGDTARHIVLADKKKLQKDELIVFYDRTNYEIWGFLRITLKQSGSLETEVILSAFASYTKDFNDAERISYCNPVVRKYTDILKGNEPCPCKYLTGDCN
jgi:hypothetical protein